MSAVNAFDPVNNSASKKKKKSKKKANGKPAAADGPVEVNGVKNDLVGEEGEEDDKDEAGELPSKITDAQPEQSEEAPPSPTVTTDPPTEAEQVQPPLENGSRQTAHSQQEPTTTGPSETSARLDVLQQERDTLRQEVIEMRKSLERLQEKHSEELSEARGELEQTQQGKEHAESQYRSLLGKVSTIRSQLGERLKADAEELEQARGRIQELEQSHTAAQEENDRLQESVSGLQSQLDSHTSEIDGLRSRTTLSTSNWAKERDDLLSREAYIREEYEVARQAMQDWEILATEERSKRETLEERMQEIEDQLAGEREGHERAKDEIYTQNNTVDGLQRALRELQEERKRELRELVEQSEASSADLRKQAQSAEDTAAELKQKLESTQKELERALPFEKEVKEKNLLIGKLRHEAVILNDHLTKALRFLKRGKPEDNVDRHIVTNHLLHFLALDRSDPKKFQVLQLIAALLGWDEQQRGQAGLLRQGGMTGSIRLPLSPFRRTPSTPALGEFIPESPSGGSRESLAELWSDFLEREAETAGSDSGRRASGMQRPSIASSGPLSPGSRE